MRRPPHKGEVPPRFTLPRHLWLAILRLLRPAEAAARRLVVALAMAMPPAAIDARVPARAPRGTSFVRGGVGTGIVLPRGARIRNAGARPRLFGFALLDPLPRFGRRRIVPNSVPRISLPGLVQPFAIAAKEPVSPDDPVDAARLLNRLAALGRALDDLPRQARRFLRWRALSAAARTKGRARRIWPLRPGRPPGAWPPPDPPPDGGRRRKSREVDEVLAHAHALALFALERPVAR